MKEEHYKFVLHPLPYEYDALEPFIDTLTMRLHHDRHLQTYIDNLNAVLKDYPKFHNWSLEDLIKYENWLPKEIRTTVKNNAGGVYNHNLYFSLLTNKKNYLSNELNSKIVETFGSFNSFKEKFKASALSVFGSGYAWLCLDVKDNLKIITTANQDTPLIFGMFPILLIDVWEHAYYLKHYNKRVDYIEDWFNVVDLAKASTMYSDYLMKKSQ